MAKRHGSGKDVGLGRTMEGKLLAAVVEQLRAAGGRGWQITGQRFGF